MYISVIGPGRAGTAISQGLRDAGHVCVLARDVDPAATVVLLAVPDDAVAAVAALVPAGPAVGMLSGSVPLAALEPHARRFVLHPMQTIQPDRDDRQVAGCAAGITASDDETAALARSLARDCAMVPLDIPEHVRPLPHIACVFASNLLFPALVGAMRTLAAAGLDGERMSLLGPLAHRAVDNALASGLSASATGPAARGDVGTVRSHCALLTEVDSDLAATYRALTSALLPLLSPAAGAAIAPALEVAG